MNARKYYPAIMGSCVAMFAACVFAQAPTPSDTAPPPATRGATEQQALPSTAAPAKTHQMKKHKATHATRSSESMARTQDDPYHTALRRCVEGQASQRDQCLDDAITRYGRS
jgi:hypothetical protein